MWIIPSQIIPIGLFGKVQLTKKKWSFIYANSIFINKVESDAFYTGIEPAESKMFDTSKKKQLMMVARRWNVVQYLSYRIWKKKFKISEVLSFMKTTNKSSLLTLFIFWLITMNRKTAPQQWNTNTSQTSENNLQILLTQFRIFRNVNYFTITKQKMNGNYILSCCLLFSTWHIRVNGLISFLTAHRQNFVNTSLNQWRLSRNINMDYYVFKFKEFVSTGISSQVFDIYLMEPYYLQVSLDHSEVILK